MTEGLNRSGGASSTLSKKIRLAVVRALLLNGAVDATIIALLTPWEAAVRRLLFVLISAMAALASPVHSLAAGAPVRKPPIDVTTMTAPPAPSGSSVSSNSTTGQGVTREPVFGGCGGRRIRDPQFHCTRFPDLTRNASTRSRK